MIIRVEKPSDQEHIRALHIASFPSCDEADLVDALRADGDAEISLVAEQRGDIIGHVMCSRMQAPFKALGLAPISVRSDNRQRSFAQRLIATALQQAKLEGWIGVFVLGDPEYYQRFGFSADMAAPFRSPYAGPYLMALSVQKSALQEAALPVQTGTIHYAPAFAALG